MCCPQAGATGNRTAEPLYPRASAGDGLPLRGGAARRPGERHRRGATALERRIASRRCSRCSASRARSRASTIATDDTPVAVSDEVFDLLARCADLSASHRWRLRHHLHAVQRAAGASSSARGAAWPAARSRRRAPLVGMQHRVTLDEERRARSPSTRPGVGGEPRRDRQGLRGAGGRPAPLEQAASATRSSRPAAARWSRSAALRRAGASTSRRRCVDAGRSRDCGCATRALGDERRRRAVRRSWTAFDTATSSTRGPDGRASGVLSASVVDDRRRHGRRARHGILRRRRRTGAPLLRGPSRTRSRCSRRTTALRTDRGRPLSWRRSWRTCSEPDARSSRQSDGAIS